jgi:hypothetical protein
MSITKIEKRLEELTYDNIVKYLRTTSADFPDKPTGQNTRYSLEDAAPGAFSVFLPKKPPKINMDRSIIKRKKAPAKQGLFVTTSRAAKQPGFS